MDTSRDRSHETEPARGVHIIARSLFREMRDQGYSTEQIIGVSSELLTLVSADLREDIEPAE